MTVEEIEIIVTAKVTEALTELSKLKPKISQIMNQAQNEISKVDFETISKKASSVQKDIKEVLDVNDTSNITIKVNGKDIDVYEKEVREASAKIKEAIEDITQEPLKKVGYKAYDTNAINDFVNNYETEDEKKKREKADQGLKNLKVSEQANPDRLTALRNKLLEARNKTLDVDKNLKDSIFNKIGTNGQNVESKETEEIEPKQSLFSKMGSGIENAGSKIDGALGKIQKVKNLLNKKSSTDLFSGLKSGISQVIKYGAALFSLRSIYSTLNGAASSWLGSQNSAAQQASANINYMKYALGSTFAPIIQNAINMVYQLMKAFQSVVYAMTGINIFAKATASSMKNTAGSANKASKSLSSVHSEINNVSKNSNSGSGTTSPSLDLSKVDKTPNSIIDAIKNGDWTSVGSLIAEKLNSVLSSIPWDKIQNTARSIGTNIANFLNGFIGKTDWNLVGNTFAQGLNTAIYGAYSFVSNFDFKQFGNAIAQGINSFINNVDWSVLASTLSLRVIGCFNALTAFISTLDTQAIWNAIVEFVGSIDWNGIIDSALEFFATACYSAVKLGMIIGNWIGEQALKARDFFADKIKEAGGDVGRGILNGILEVITSIEYWIKDHIFQPFINGFKNVFGIHSPSTVMAEMGNYIMQGLLNGISALVFKVQNIWDNIKQKFKDGAKEAWNAMTSVFGNVKEWFQDKFSSAWTAVKDVFSSGGAVFGGIKEGIESTFKTIVNGLIDGINKVVSIPFSGINKALSKIRDINIAGISPFKNLITTISVPSLPHLKTGNVAYEKTLAVFGEYSNAKSNPEITAPRNVLKEVFDDSLSAHNFNNQQSNNLGGLKTLIIKFGSMNVALEIEELLREARRQNGTATVNL